LDELANYRSLHSQRTNQTDWGVLSMTVAELIQRASSQVGKNTVYALGTGSSQGLNPRDERGRCDCSAFVCWCLNLPKHQPQIVWLRNVNGGWYNTDGMWWDTVKETTGFFSPVAAAKVGAIVVYPSKTIAPGGPSIGHVGLITKVNPDGTYRVIHCSSGNFRNSGDAIRETEATVFNRPSARFAWSAMVIP